MSDIHSCSYYCTRPACVLQQRDELRSVLALAAIAERQKRQAEPVVDDGQEYGIDEDTGKVK